MSKHLKSLWRRLRLDQHGSVAALVGFGIVAFVGFAAIVVDVGYLVYAKRMLQASTDAAALAGAQDINRGTSGTALATATSYSSAAGNLNARANLNVTMASGFPQYVCFSSTGISCSNANNANGIRVKQNATVPLFFGRVLGFNSATISASAVAGSAGGTAQPVDAMIVLDTTPSMNLSDPNCAVSGMSRLGCAFTGFRTLLQGFTPSMDHVGLMIFPGLKSSSSPSKTAAQNAELEYDCSSSTPADPSAWFSSYSRTAIAKYDESSNPPITTPPVYLIVPLSNDYKISDGATTLNTNSNLVKAARGGGSGCTAGVSGTSFGGYGIVVRTYFADAVKAAKNYLSANGRTGVQKLIIFIGDGDSVATTDSLPSSKVSNQCRRAITEAQAATAADMTVITIAYGAQTSTTGSSENCPFDSPRISPCDTLRQMASSSDRFYSDNTNAGTSCTSAANPMSDLNEIFQHIGTSVGTGARLLPDNTT
jgi:Flp pilus assembly protein TadG